MNPPTGGPRMGPIMAGTISQVIAETISLRSTERRITRRPTGTIMAPPMPCRILAATNSASPPDRPHRMLPRVNRAMAARNTVRVPKRSATLPLAGMNTARLSR